MTHLEDRDLVALRDGDEVEATIRDHLEQCDACQSALEDAHARAASITDVLGTLDAPVDLEASRAALSARMALRNTQDVTPITTQRSRRTGTGSFTPLRRAAAVLLISAGAAWAIPGSPVPGWVTGSPAVERTGAAEATPEDAAMAARAGVRLPLADEPIVVHLDGVASGTRVEVVRTTDSAVTVYAAAGSTFASGTQDLRATLAEGPVTIEGPWDGFGALTVNGETILERTDGSWRIVAPVEEVADDRIIILVGG